MDLSTHLPQYMTNNSNHALCYFSKVYQTTNAVKETICDFVSLIRVFHWFPIIARGFKVSHTSIILQTQGNKKTHKWAIQSNQYVISGRIRNEKYLSTDHLTETLENKRSVFLIFILDDVNRKSFCVLYLAFQSTICSETSSPPARGWRLLLVLAHLLANERLGNLIPLSITRLQR